jgi:hypothetical protein
MFSCSGFASGVFHKAGKEYLSQGFGLFLGCGGGFLSSVFGKILRTGLSPDIRASVREPDPLPREVASFDGVLPCFYGRLRD